MATVLVVEDDELLSNAYRLMLEKDGHQVEVAENGTAAVLLAAKTNPDVILLDLIMPQMSGLDFLKEFDQPKQHPNTTVVVLSNIGNEREVRKALRLGAYKYIVKAHATPIQLSLLVNNLIRKNIDGKTPNP